MIFLRFSMLHQILSYTFRVNLYLLYIFGIPATLAIFLSGGMLRVLRYRTAVYWVLFVIWLLIAVPFSSWRGGSAGLAYTYLRTEFIMMFIVGGVAIDRRECRLVLQAIAAACVVNLFISRFFGEVDTNDRMSLIQFGTVSNANDFAGHLILVLPFLLWVTLSTKNALLRILSIGGLAWGTYLIIASGSRGAGLAILAGVIFLVVSAPGQLRLSFLVMSPMVILLAVFLVPQHTLQRILSFSSTAANTSDEAMLSSKIRERLLRDSLKDMIDHPLFGVGPGQFTETEGKAE